MMDLKEKRGGWCEREKRYEVWGLQGNKALM
jgi:hypothetical protein